MASEPAMSFEEIFLSFLVALAAGSLIGLEREQSRALDKKPSVIITAMNRDTKPPRSVEGKVRLREELVRTINDLLPHGGVRSVYFADFLIK